MNDTFYSKVGRPISTLLGGGRQVAPLVESPPPPQPITPAPADALGDDESVYRAFRTDRTGRAQRAVEIRLFEPRLGIEEGYLLAMPQFIQAHFIHTDHVVLHFAHTVFEVEGRGVRQLVELLKHGILSTVQEWNGSRWPEPPASEPKITRIRAITPEMVMAQEAVGRTRERTGEMTR